MQYMFLIMDNEQADALLSEEQHEAHYAAHFAYSDKMEKAGVKKGGLPLQPSSTATTLRSSDGIERVVSDGPYAEAKEHLGGFYLVEVADLDEALSWARQLPLRPGSAVEVRPVMATGG
jgi:hypothetical protein